MMAQICESDDAELCKWVLALVTVAYCPISLEESTSFVQMPKDMHDVDCLREIVGHCGSFLTVRNDTIYFVHQSAKDFLLGKASSEIFPRGIEVVHRAIFSRSLGAMTKTLRRDMYCLGYPGFPIEQVRIPATDPLAAARYSCVYWIDHLCDSHSGRSTSQDNDLRDNGAIHTFLRQKYLYWLEALSLLRSMSEGVIAMQRLESQLVRLVSLYNNATLVSESRPDIYLGKYREPAVDGPSSRRAPIYSISQRGNRDGSASGLCVSARV